MRKSIKLVAVFVFIVVFGALSFEFYKVYQKKNILLSNIAILPKIELFDVDGVLYTENQIKENSWTVLVFFNTQCHYCQEEGRKLKLLEDQIGKTQFLWISNESKELIKTFQSEYGLSTKTKTLFLQDRNGKLASSLGISSIPEFLVYNSEGKLAKNHKGGWRMEILLKSIENGFKVHKKDP